MKAFLERHVGAYRLSALFDAHRLQQSVRLTLTVLISLVSLLMVGLSLIFGALSPGMRLMDMVFFGIAISTVGGIQLWLKRPSPLWLFVVISVFIAVGATLGDNDPMPGLVAGITVASTGTLLLTESRRKGFLPQLIITISLSIGLYRARPTAGTVLGIIVLVLAQWGVWWVLGTILDEVRQMGSRFEGLVADSSTITVITNNEGRIEYANKAASEMLGDVLGESIATFAAVDRIETEEHQGELRTPGGPIPVLARRTPLTGVQGFSMYLFVDIRERIAAQKRTAALEKQYRDLFDQVPVGLYTTTPDGAILKANTHLHKMFGFDSVEELQAVSASDLYVDAEHRSELLSRLGEDGTASSEYQVRRRDGSIIWVRDHCSIEFSSDGTPVLYYGELTDITAEREATEDLREAVVQRDQLIAAVSHELRTPLTSVLGLAHLMAAGEVDGAEQEELSNLLLAQSQDLSYIVEDLLAASRLRNGQLRVLTQRLDLGAMVAEAYDTVEFVDRSVSIDLPPGVFAFGDPLRIRQVVRNLLTNAGKYGGSQVAVGVSSLNGNATVVVSDNGTGLGTVPERAFEAFVRLGESTTDHGSLGLGLHLARGLADAMGGSLEYGREDGWSRFTLSLPRA